MRGMMSIGPGWLPLFTELCEYIESLIQKDPENVFIWRQVKEKFGSLRAYYDFRGSDEVRILIHKAIDEAEVKSCSVCEVCGDPGHEAAPRGWIKTLCDIHDHNEYKMYDDQ